MKADEDEAVRSPNSAITARLGYIMIVKGDDKSYCCNKTCAIDSSRMISNVSERRQKTEDRNRR